MTLGQNLLRKNLRDVIIKKYYSYLFILCIWLLDDELVLKYFDDIKSSFVLIPIFELISLVNIMSWLEKA